MQIDRQEILDVLAALGREDEARQAERDLPERVDPDEHADLLGRYGLDARHLADKAAGQSGDFGQQGGLLAGEGV